MKSGKRPDTLPKNAEVRVRGKFHFLSGITCENWMQISTRYRPVWRCQIGLQMLAGLMRFRVKVKLAIQNLSFVIVMSVDFVRLSALAGAIWFRCALSQQVAWKKAVLAIISPPAEVFNFYILFIRGNFSQLEKPLSERLISTWVFIWFLISHRELIPSKLAKEKLGQGIFSEGWT